MLYATTIGTLSIRLQRNSPAPGGYTVVVSSAALPDLKLKLHCQDILLEDLHGNGHAVLDAVLAHNLLPATEDPKQRPIQSITWDEVARGIAAMPPEKRKEPVVFVTEGDEEFDVLHPIGLYQAKEVIDDECAEPAPAGTFYLGYGSH